jgi:hypothetical protein
MEPMSVENPFSGHNLSRPIHGVAFMRRLVLVIAAFFVLGSSTAVLAQTHSALAPADQYFGRMKMSILGIRNSIKDLDYRASGGDQGDATHVYDKLVLVEDALRDWQSRYPHDTWLPRYTHDLAMVYRKLPLEEAHVRSNDLFDILHSRYGNSEYAESSRF